MDIDPARKARTYVGSTFEKHREHGQQKGDILDVGCGEGLFLELAKQNGWRVHGTDVSAYATKFASKRLGQNCFAVKSGTPDSMSRAST